jgi:tetratricopeptide (TPR) repeat protein
MLSLFVAFAAAVAAPPQASATPVSGGISPAAKTAGKQSAVLDSLYQAALVLLHQKSWYEASIVLERIWLLQPDYRNVIDHLAVARAQMCISGAGGSRSQVGRHSLYRGGMLTMVAALPLLAYLLLAPAPRVRFYAWRGDYERAAQICEKALARHPHRVSLYLTLANLYLLAGRRDQRARTAYALMRLLHLVSSYSEEDRPIIVPG